MVVEKAFDVATSTTNLFLCTPYNHLGVICDKICHKGVMSCRKLDDTTLFQFFESCQKVELTAVV